MLILAEAGLRPSFVIGGDVTDIGTGRAVDRRRVVRRRGRRERRHVPRAAAARHDPDQRRGRPPRPLRHASTAIVDGFDRYLGQIAGPEGAVRRRPGRAPSSAPRHGAVTYGTADGADYRAVDLARRPRRRSRSPSTHDGERARRRSTCRCAACTTCATPPARWPWRMALGVAVRRRRRRRWPASAASPAASTSAASTAARRSSTTTPTCRPRSPPCSPRRATSGDGWQRVVAVFQPNRYNRMAVLSPEYARRVRRRRPRRAHRHLPVGQAPRSPASPASSSSTPCSTPTREHAGGVAAAARRPRRVPRRRAARRRRLHLDGLRRHRHRCPTRCSHAGAELRPARERDRRRADRRGGRAILGALAARRRAARRR